MCCLSHCPNISSRPRSPKLPLLSVLQNETLFVFLISPVNFSCPICSTPFSSPPTNIHCPVQIMQLLTVQFCSSHCYFLSLKKIPSFPVLALFFHVLSLEHKDTPSNTHNSVYPKLSIHNSVLLCTISVICVNSCVLNSFTIKGFKEVNYFMSSQIILCYN